MTIWQGRKGEQATHCYEYHSLSVDDCRKSFEQWGALCFQNEYSDVVVR